MIFRKIFLFVLFLIPPLSSQADPAVWLRLQGSNTVGAKLAPALAKQFLEQRGVVQVTVKSTAVENEFLVSGIDSNSQREVGISVAAHGTATGFQALASGTADVAMASRPIKSDENKQLLDQFGDMSSEAAEHSLAIDGLAILVNSKNPIAELNREQIAGLFSGAIRNWKEVGGADLPVVIYARDERSGTWETFKELVLGKNYQLDGGAQRYESSDKLSDAVAANSAAIGFSGLASVRNARVLRVSETNTAALAPSRANVATEDYLLTRRLFLYTPPRNANAMIGAFIEFCLSERGQKTVADIGFISQNIDEIKGGDFANAPEKYSEIARSANRLSVNFRFKDGSAQLDNKALRDVDRLASYLVAPANSDRKIFLMGFSSFEKNEKRDYVLSRFRALAVRAALMKKGVNVFELQGLGAAMPVASNNEMASVKNNRVEVWVGT